MSRPAKTSHYAPGPYRCHRGRKRRRSTSAGGCGPGCHDRSVRSPISSTTSPPSRRSSPSPRNGGPTAGWRPATCFPPPSSRPRYRLHFCLSYAAVSPAGRTRSIALHHISRDLWWRVLEVIGPETASPKPDVTDRYVLRVHRPLAYLPGRRGSSRSPQGGTATGDSSSPPPAHTRGYRDHPGRLGISFGAFGCWRWRAGVGDHVA
jgi:hypothetical protein